jgi:hypothetical protein
VVHGEHVIAIVAERSPGAGDRHDREVAEGTAPGRPAGKQKRLCGAGGNWAADLIFAFRVRRYFEDAFGSSHGVTATFIGTEKAYRDMLFRAPRELRVPSLGTWARRNHDGTAQTAGET